MNKFQEVEPFQPQMLFDSTLDGEPRMIGFGVFDRRPKLQVLIVPPDSCFHRSFRPGDDEFKMWRQVQSN